jgi:hypothetical protein
VVDEHERAAHRLDEVRRLHVPVHERHTVGPVPRVEQVERLRKGAESIEEAPVAFGGDRDRDPVDEGHLDEPPSVESSAAEHTAPVDGHEGGMVDTEQPATPSLDLTGVDERIGPDELQRAPTSGGGLAPSQTSPSPPWPTLLEQPQAGDRPRGRGVGGGHRAPRVRLLGGVWTWCGRPDLAGVRWPTGCGR